MTATFVIDIRTLRQDRAEKKKKPPPSPRTLSPRERESVWLLIEFIVEKAPENIYMHSLPLRGRVKGEGSGVRAP
jgi:hypothetical protein